jgi:hypothetical protein
MDLDHRTQAIKVSLSHYPYYNESYFGKALAKRINLSFIN